MTIRPCTDRQSRTTKRNRSRQLALGVVAVGLLTSTTAPSAFAEPAHSAATSGYAMSRESTSVADPVDKPMHVTVTNLAEYRGRMVPITVVTPQHGKRVLQPCESVDIQMASTSAKFDCRIVEHVGTERPLQLSALHDDDSKHSTGGSWKIEDRYHFVTVPVGFEQTLNFHSSSYTLILERHADSATHSNFEVFVGLGKMKKPQR